MLRLVILLSVSVIAILPFPYNTQAAWNIFVSYSSGVGYMKNLDSEMWKTGIQDGFIAAFSQIWLETHLWVIVCVGIGVAMML